MTLTLALTAGSEVETVSSTLRQEGVVMEEMLGASMDQLSVAMVEMEGTSKETP